MTDQPIAAENAAPKPRRVAPVVAVLLVLGLGLGGLVLFTRRPPAEPPRVDLADSPSNVVSVVEEAMQRVADNGRSSETWGHLGTVLFAHDYFDEAAACFEVAEQLDPGRSRWVYLRGTSLMFADPARAIECFRRSAELRTDDPLPRLRAAELLLAMNRLAEAEVQLKAAARLEPRNPRAQLGLGRLAFLRGDLEQSLLWTTRAAATAPMKREVRELLGQVHYRLGNTEAMERELRALKGIPEQRNPWPDRHLNEALRWCRSAGHLFDRANDLQQQDRMTEAIQVLEQAIAVDRSNPRGYLLLGFALMQVGDLSSSARVLDDALRLDPSSAEGHYYRGLNHLLNRNWPPAARSFREAILYKPDYAAAQANLGRCRKELGDSEGAIESLNDALGHRPELAIAHVWLAELLLESDRRSEAIGHLETAVELSPDDERLKRQLERAIAE
jgi:tetratricopeptide (TPR) repeat protein